MEVTRLRVAPQQQEETAQASAGDRLASAIADLPEDNSSMFVDVDCSSLRSTSSIFVKETETVIRNRTAAI